STALHYAIGHGSWMVVTILLDSGCANVNQLNHAGYSPVMVAAISSAETDEDLKVVDRLLSMGDVNMRSRGGQHTPLILAAGKGAKGIVDLLMSHQVDINKQNSVGNTALMCAAEKNYVDIVRRLLKRREIDLSLKDNEGKTALDIATEARNNRVAEMIQERMNESSRVNLISNSPVELDLDEDSGYSVAPSANLQRRVVVKRGRSIRR
ncbi:hypothetical protein Ciccas_013417, partial [Cichlidogyrus casuarinus]